MIGVVNEAMTWETIYASSAGLTGCVWRLIATANTILPQNGLPITDIVVTHAHDSSLFGDAGAEHFCGNLTK